MNPGPAGERGPAALPPGPSLGALQLAGVGLFLFIPLVLFFFVAHPEPIAASLGAGVALMLGHRLVARPYMQRARLRKCLWCNRGPRDGVPFALRTAAGELAAVVCRRHRPAASRLFTFLARARMPLRAGIFVPLLCLLAALVAAAAGERRWLPLAVPVFKLVVGATVNVAALGYLAVRAPAPVPRLVFPAHNFFLLGTRALLWVFRLVGTWWIVRGALGLLAAAR